MEEREQSAFVILFLYLYLYCFAFDELVCTASWVTRPERMREERRRRQRKADRRKQEMNVEVLRQSEEQSYIEEWRLDDMYVSKEKGIYSDVSTHTSTMTLRRKERQRERKRRQWKADREQGNECRRTELYRRMKAR